MVGAALNAGTTTETRGSSITAPQHNARVGFRVDDHEHEWRLNGDGSLFLFRPAHFPVLILVVGGSSWSSRCGLDRGVCCRATFHAHLIHRRPDGGKCSPYLRFAQAADAADAEAVSDRQLAGIDHVASLAQPIVERVELEARIGGHMEGDDDWRLQIVWQERFE